MFDNIIISEMEAIIKIKNLLWDILFPPLCLNCQKLLGISDATQPICNQCQQTIVSNTTFFCPICKAHLPENKKICHQNAKYLLAAATHYSNDAVRSLIWHFKYKRWQRLQNILGSLLINYWQVINYPATNWLVTPIPLHKDRQKQRGFNQSELLAEIFAESQKLPLQTDNLIRIKMTQTQTEFTDRQKRMANVSNCFQIRRPEQIQNQNIILVDDVFTSGATAGEAAQVLKSAGAKKIIVLVIAKSG